MSTQTRLAQGGNVIGHGVPVHPLAITQTTRQPNWRLLYALTTGGIIAAVAINIMYVCSLLHPFNFSAANSTNTTYTYTAVSDPLRWVWFAFALATWVIIPIGVFFIRERFFGYMDALTNFAAVAVAGVVLVLMSCTLPPTVLLKQDLAAHANTWLQQHLNTTYDVTDEIGGQDRFTEKLDALTIDGKTVHFYLSRANNTVMIRPSN